MGLGLKTLLKNRLAKEARERQMIAEMAREEFLVMQFYNTSKLQDLTLDEKAEVRSVWGGMLIALMNIVCLKHIVVLTQDTSRIICTYRSSRGNLMTIE